MRDPQDISGAAQSAEEMRVFVEAFARVTVGHIREVLRTQNANIPGTLQSLDLDWDDEAKLMECGLSPELVSDDARAGSRYLHIDTAASPTGLHARQTFLGLSGLSDKQQKILFPLLRTRAAVDRPALSAEVARLNSWLDEVRADGFDPFAFLGYQSSIGIHGRAQNTTGGLGAAGACVAFVDAIRELKHDAIEDTVGILTPAGVRTPKDIDEWLRGGPNRVVKALLLTNGRAIVFASSKDANIFEPLGGNAFSDAADALKRFNAVAKDQRLRSQRLHEHAVGEVKTATDPANLHERMGLASRETQTELRTDRFLMMALLNREILSGGTQGRVLNNRDLTRFSHVFNLHHCWGWDGGRERHPEHWRYFKESLGEWCGI